MPIEQPFYFFGSADSVDTDVLVHVEIIGTKKESYDTIKALRGACPPDWNINLIVVEDGHIVDTVTSNSMADSLNNSLYTTYRNHAARQRYPNPIEGPVPRKLALACYRALRCMLTYCTRTSHRSQIKPHLKGIHPFEHKPRMLALIDFETLEDFGNKYSGNTDIWKSLAFYLGQTLSLIEGVEIYTKSDLVLHHPELAPFIQRKALTDAHKTAFSQKRDALIEALSELDFKNPSSGVLVLGDEMVDMVKEVPINP